jgi:alanine racemase
MLLRPTLLKIDTGNLRRNYRNVQKLIPPGCEIIAVVKADAYSQGLTQVAKVFSEEGCRWFAVATPDEALELRHSGIEGEILVMAASFPATCREYVLNDITAACGDLAFLEHMEQAGSALGRKGKIHLKFDTGLGRTGFFEEDIPYILKTLERCPHTVVSGAFTHFATADEQDPDYTKWQFSRFRAIMDSFEKAGKPVPFEHVCNSSATINFPEMALSAVRPGNLLYGLPSGYCARPVELHPSCSLETRIAVIRELPPGTGVGYGLKYMTRGKERIGILPIGFHDGITRLLSGKAEVLIRGKRAPVIGNICMDQTMVDLTDMTEAQTGDQVVIFGRQGEEEITVQEIATKLDTVVTQILSFIGKRVPRIYI